jgi:hypothetical protein
VGTRHPAHGAKVFAADSLRIGIEKIGVQLNGAAFTTPSVLIVVTHAIGRGTTSAARTA